MTRSRRGITLLEVCLAIAIVAIPAVYGLSLIQQNTRNARLDAERARAQALLSDVLELVASEGPQGASSYTGQAGEGKLRALAEKRVLFEPESPGDPGHRAELALARRMTGQVESAGDVPGYVRITLTLPLERGQLQMSRGVRASDSTARVRVSTSP
jgi:hypothetical protein